jgi:hypothetical protein
MPQRQKAKKANKAIEIVALDGKPVGFQYTGDALKGDKVDIEYTEVVCKHLLGCTECTDGTSALDLAHLKNHVSGRAAMLDEQTSEPELRVRYTAEANGTLHIRSALKEGKWCLELPAEITQATEP